MQQFARRQRGGGEVLVERVGSKKKNTQKAVIARLPLEECFSAAFEADEGGRGGKGEFLSLSQQPTEIRRRPKHGQRKEKESARVAAQGKTALLEKIV